MMTQANRAASWASFRYWAGASRLARRAEMPLHQAFLRLSRQTSDTLMDIYGFDASEGFISDVTDKLLPQIEDWQKRPLDSTYPVFYIDAIHYSVRSDSVIRKLAAYVILGINLEGKKDVLTIEVGENESAKYWLSVLNTLKYVADKDKKAFATDLKKIYSAPNEQAALDERDRVSDKWNEKYPNAMKSWGRHWDAITPIFKFSSDVRKAIYTTNAIESLSSTYRKLNHRRNVFPSNLEKLNRLGQNQLPSIDMPSSMPYI